MFSLLSRIVFRHTNPARSAATRTSIRRRLCSIEALEGRELLSVTSAEPANDEETIGVFPRQLRRESRTDTRAIAPELNGKIQPRLWAAVERIEEELARGAFTIVPGSTREAQVDLTNIAAARVNEAGAIHVYAEMRNFEADALQSVNALGLEIVRANERYGAIEIWVPYDLVDDLAALDAVGLVRVPEYGVVRTGQVTSAGDGIHRADNVRERFSAVMSGIDGSGVSIGVISSGVDNRSEVQGGGTPDLPTITVDPNQSGSGDEGTAMLEIIHDLAPGADLYFSSGDAGAMEFLDALGWLVDQEVDIIVDDIGYYEEHFFSDTSIAQAVQAAIGEGVVYVTAAGNDAQLHYQGQWSEAPSGFHNFGDDDLLDIGWIPPGGEIDIYLQWSDPPTASSNDYDLGLWDPIGEVYVALSEDDQTGTQAPLEVINWTNTTQAAIYVAADIFPFNDPASRELELFVLPWNFSLSSLDDSDRTQADSVFGHPAVAGAIAVGAINAGDPGNDTVASYSSQGLSTIYTNFTSQTKTMRQSVAGAGIDGVETRIGELQYFDNPFFGTSAAAPHVAAIAALVLNAAPTLTPAQVSSILTTTAVDVGTTGYDIDSGWGRFDALSAVYKAFTPAVPQLATSSDTGVSDSDGITNDNTPTFIGTVPANSFVRLYVDGVQRGTQQLTGGATEFSITTSTLTDGVKNVTIRVAENSNTPTANLSNPSPALEITIDTVGPRITGVIVGSSSSGSDPDYPVPDGSGEQIRSIPVGGPDEFSVTFSEDVYIQSADISLIDVATSNAFSVGDFDYDDNTYTAKITLQNPLTEAFQIILRVEGQSVMAGDVIDIAGNLLDGEWDNPTDVEQSSSKAFPSGNGTAGGTFEFYLTRLPDANLNNIVEQADLDAVLLNWGDPGSFEDGDFNGNGTVEQADLDQVLTFWATDYTEWPDDEFLMMSGGGSSYNYRLDALQALDAALAEHGMHDRRTQRILTEDRMELAASDAEAWDALLSDIASALDKQVKRGGRGAA